MSNDQKETIRNNPRKFKVCCACGSILYSHAKQCAQCHAYGFLESEADVIAALHRIEKLGQSGVAEEDLK